MKDNGGWVRETPSDIQENWKQVRISHSIKQAVTQSKQKQKLWGYSLENMFGFKMNIRENNILNEYRQNETKNDANEKIK